MKVKNYTTEIEKALNLDAGSCKHIGNYQFSATLNEHKVLVNTEPDEDDLDYIRIYSIEL